MYGICRVLFGSCLAGLSVFEVGKLHIMITNTLAYDIALAGEGGHFHWRPYQMIEGEKRGERISKSGVGAERANLKKGVKIGGNGGKGYPNRYDQSSSHTIKRRKGR